MKTNNLPHHRLTSSEAETLDFTPHHGLILIPDISGFTSFVHQTDLHLGRRVTAELLDSILAHNVLGLRVSEIEGDAVLFYRFGPPPSVAEVLAQYEHMLDGFQRKVAALSRQLGTPLDLSLKLIAHYGALAEYQVGGFRKLYGESVIEAHRLLKNAVPSSTYALITDELSAAAPPRLALPRRQGVASSKLCAVYGDLRHLCFTYFDYETAPARQLVA